MEPRTGIANFDFTGGQACVFAGNRTDITSFACTGLPVAGIVVCFGINLSAENVSIARIGEYPHIRNIQRQVSVIVKRSATRQGITLPAHGCTEVDLRKLICIFSDIERDIPPCFPITFDRTAPELDHVPTRRRYSVYRDERITVVPELDSNDMFGVKPGSVVSKGRYDIESFSKRTGISRDSLMAARIPRTAPFVTSAFKPHFKVDLALTFICNNEIKRSQSSQVLCRSERRPFRTSHTRESYGDIQQVGNIVLAFAIFAGPEGAAVSRFHGRPCAGFRTCGVATEPGISRFYIVLAIFVTMGPSAALTELVAVPLVGIRISTAHIGIGHLAVLAIERTGMAYPRFLVSHRLSFTRTFRGNHSVCSSGGKRALDSGRAVKALRSIIVALPADAIDLKIAMRQAEPDIFIGHAGMVVPQARKVEIFCRIRLRRNVPAIVIIAVRPRFQLERIDPFERCGQHNHAGCRDTRL